MTHWTGTYSGWATKGGTDYEHLQIALEQAEKDNPDSKYWQACAHNVMQDLANLLDTAPYAQWAELVWPGAAIDDCTYQTLYLQSKAALTLAKFSDERDLKKLAQAARRVTELPFRIELGENAPVALSQDKPKTEICQNHAGEK